MKGAARELTRMREEGIIRAWGLGVNQVEYRRGQSATKAAYRLRLGAAIPGSRVVTTCAPSTKPVIFGELVP